MAEYTKKVSILILTYNSSRYLRPLLESLFHQTERDFEIIAIDNASSDDTLQILKNEYASRVRVIANPENYWFSKGFNIGIRQAVGKYVMICNHDIVLEPDFVKHILESMERDPSIGAAGGKLLKFPSDDMPFSYRIDDIKNVGHPLKIDTTGIQVFRSRRAIDRGESDVDSGQYNTPEEVFGMSGAFICIRRDALEAVRYKDEYFDEDIMAYKDDYDMSWRLRHAGYKIFYIPSAVGYHNRRVSRTTGLGDRETVLNRKGKSKIDNIQSYKNHWHILVKNDTFINILRDFPFIFWYELKKFVYVLFFEHHTLRAIGIFWRQFPLMWRKRKFIMSHSHVAPAEVRRWFV